MLKNVSLNGKNIYKYIQLKVVFFKWKQRPLRECWIALSLQVFVIMFGCAIGGMAFPKYAYSQAGVDPLVHPANRYTAENISVDRLSYWEGAVVAQFLGFSDGGSQMAALSNVLSLSNASRLDASIVGFPDNIFGGSEVSYEARIVIFIYDAEYEYSLTTSGASLKGFGGIDFSEANAVIKEVAKAGLFKQVNGCFASWSASERNEIRGFILAISDDLPGDEAIKCIERITPAAFGISSFVSRYDFSQFDLRQDVLKDAIASRPIIFDDYSERFLQLSVAAACRMDLGDYSFLCPLRVINSIFENHAKLTTLRFHAK
ncbi:hypothetical protein J7382_09975 [Shimia sp. R11_0]|uniref:hypothetical protein n=1 Tax=Shimia sp. R11_0 TaxID=2821096 RepID=UPI001ADA2144|nr:hypothetical protein [Shimia sp. R11_0]MBO9477862.1 hypothetical protein [Shimia sp. R11_0]